MMTIPFSDTTLHIILVVLAAAKVVVLAWSSRRESA
jgi:hypothetical protein